MLTREFRMGIYFGFALGMLTVVLDHPDTRRVYFALFLLSASTFLFWWGVYYWGRQS
jgi:hypothetical protein